MKKLFLIFSFFLTSVAVASASSFSLDSTDAYDYQDNYITATNGSLKVYIVDSLSSNSALTFQYTGGDSIYNCKFFTYTTSVDSLTPVQNIKVKGASVSITGLKLDCGYMLQYSTDAKDSVTYTRYVWLTKFLPMQSVSWNDTVDYCESLPLSVSPVMYYTNLLSLSAKVKRTLNATYSVYEMEDGEEIDSKTEIISGDDVFYIPSTPTVNTSFVLSDTHFKDEYTTDTFYTMAVNAFPQLTTTATMDNEDDASKDIFKTDAEGNIVYYYGGSVDTFRSSGPLEIYLQANASKKVNDLQWWISSDSAFTKYSILYNQPYIKKTFDNKQQYCIKLIASNTESGCEYSKSMCFRIKSSELLIPNVFTPNGSSFQKFKVAYSSIESFSCRIYDQWGRKVYDSDDINEGWDGKYKGSDAPTGAYFYVITAKGIDDISYNKKGTINLVRNVR